MLGFILNYVNKSNLMVTTHFLCVSTKQKRTSVGRLKGFLSQTVCMNIQCPMVPKGPSKLLKSQERLSDADCTTVPRLCLELAAFGSELT